MPPCTKRKFSDTTLTNAIPISKPIDRLDSFLKRTFQSFCLAIFQNDSSITEISCDTIMQFLYQENQARPRPFDDINKYMNDEEKDASEDEELFSKIENILISKDILPFLSRALKKNNVATTLDLSRFYYFYAGKVCLDDIATWFLGILKNNSTLTKIDFPFTESEKNRLSIELFNSLVAHLTLNKSIRSVDFHNWGNSPRLSAESIFLISELFKKNTVLSSVALSHLNLSPGLICLSPIASSKTLINLNLSCCKLKVSGGLYFAKILRENASLETIDLSGNNLTDKAGIAIIKAIKKNARPIKRLDLSSNLLSAKFTETLDNEVKIRSLLLSHNKIISSSLAHFIKETTHLVILEAMGSQDFDNQIIDVITALANNTSLTRFDVCLLQSSDKYDDGLEQNIATTLQNALQTNKTILSFSNTNHLEAMSRRISNSNNYFQPFLERNKRNKEKKEIPWIAIYILIVSARSNKDNPLKDSVRELLPMILDYVSQYHIVKIKNSGQLSQYGIFSISNARILYLEEKTEVALTAGTSQPCNM